MCPYSMGVIFGFILATIILTVVDGAVKTSIVCFAESPDAFEQNHPILYQAMAETFRATYPDLFERASPSAMDQPVPRRNVIFTFA
mmetsp:Transcript_15570/g.23730  ORF Transcript_15570/g.23730 Transcript_15570/m.23730 type:complete len:86 (-) Transcript_15570:445-702(-)